MGFLDEIMDTLTKTADAPGPLGATVRGIDTGAELLRYGVTPQEKNRLMRSGEIPGQPPLMLPGGGEDPRAIRYASNYLAAKAGRPDVVTDLFNRFALEDSSEKRSPEDAAAIKASGLAGMQQAQRDRGWLKNLAQVFMGGGDLVRRP